MATEDPMRVMAANGIRGGLGVVDNARASSGINTSSVHDNVAEELGILLRNHSHLDSILSKRDAGFYRSGSAPPSVQGSLASLGGLFPSTGGSRRGIPGPGQEDGSDVIDSEQELRSDPAYLTYYYSHVNRNPRLPPPLVTRENYVLAQRLASSGYSDKRNPRYFDDSNSRSLFSSQSMLPTHSEEPEFSEDDKSPMGNALRQASGRWRERNTDGFSAFSSVGLGNRPKSLVDLIQEDFPRTPSPVYNLSRSSSRIANEDGIDAAAVAELSATLLGPSTATPSTGLASRSATPNPGLSSRSATPNSALAHMIGANAVAASSGVLGPTARIQAPEPSTVSSSSNISITQTNQRAAGTSELPAAFQGLSLSSAQQSADQQDLHALQLSEQKLQQATREQLNSLPTQQLQHQGHRPIISQAQTQFSDANYRVQPKYGSQDSQLPNQSAHMYAAAAAAAAMSYMAANPYYQNLQAYAPHYGLGGYGMNPALIPAIMGNYSSPVNYDSTTAAVAAAAAAAAALAAGIGTQGPVSGSSSGLGVDMQQMYKSASQAGASLQSPLHDPLYYHYLQQHSVDDTRTSANFNDSSLSRGYASGSALDLQKTYLNSMFGYPSERRGQPIRSGSLGVPLGSKSGSMSPVYYGSPPGVGFVMPYTNSPLSSPILPGSPVIPGAFSFRQQAEQNYMFTSGSGRNTSGTPFVGWQGHKASDVGGNLKGSSLLEELKNNKTRRFELADIMGHVVEFSADQHGSRFIQQKLESVSSEEKASVFKEVLPHALTLMTDVFGNYVIQKFFEHGSPEQRSELADCLVGHVLSLSLQMYGCRVIQKALEVIDTEQQIQLVSELEGQVMRCVRDQNGNHVIQKCIECVPSEHIHFIVSAFQGQVVMLSTHPYGCRVIQRVLEHYTDAEKKSTVMEEILCSVCTLAQDQYGNYVVQHILEHGKPEERNEIITKLAGQIVQMSQHKFASNVVEKCLEFGGPAEREILITEMLGHTDENEPLQAMMKDQYANYVVQKVLETCDDHHRELLLARIRVHLHALKKYTYGKHIVARVEKLVAAGERRSSQVA